MPGKEKSVEELAAEQQRVSGRGDTDEIANFYDHTDTGDLPCREADDVVVERPEPEQISGGLPKEDLDALRRRAAKVGSAARRLYA